MPLARIDCPTHRSPEERKALGDVVYEAMLVTLNVPENDRFQIICGRAPDELIVDPTYLGIARSAEAVIIQVTLNEGRDVAMKQAFYKAVADGLKARLGLRGEDCIINLVEVRRENGSFGNGVAQYA